MLQTMWERGRTSQRRGIGRVIAERFAAEGATVAITYNASSAGAEEAVAAQHSLNHRSLSLANKSSVCVVCHSLR